jgi:hypothetical protein
LIYLDKLGDPGSYYSNLVIAELQAQFRGRQVMCDRQHRCRL